MNGILFKYMVAALLLMHPYYISMTEIEHDKTNNTLEISVRIFTDDLEKTIRKTYTGKVDLLNKNEKPNSEKLIRQYITKHLSLKADGKNLNMNFVGFESEEGSVWSYFECTNIFAIKKLEVSNTILYDYRDQEINFIHVKANTYNETIKLNYPDNYKEFVIN